MSRKLKIDKNYIPLPTFEGDEIYPNGIFHFNISRILQKIEAGNFDVVYEKINVEEWFKMHFYKKVNENHVLTVDINMPILQAEISPNIYEIIDGNHRIEKAYREGI